MIDGENRRAFIRKAQTLNETPIRTCYTVHECCLCGGDITCGQSYADRGIRRRAHYDCIPGLGVDMEPWQVAEREADLAHR